MADSPDSSELTPAIRQDMTGNRNQMIGQMLGGVVINHLTIHERIPEPSLPPLVSAAKPLTQQEYRRRKVLLNKVKEYWIKGVLETSIHTKVLIELGLQERPEMVQRPFSGVEEFPPTPGQALPAGTASTTVFDQMDEGRTLLILGEPGSGKTITLLKLTEDLIARTEADLSQPIPVVFNLSSWAKKSQSIEQWLVQELQEKYQVSQVLGKDWVEKEDLLLLLDGLDEVKVEQRNTFVQALNQFIQTHGITELAVCCRIRDYQALTDKLTLRNAICIQPLTNEQVKTYFDQIGGRLNALRTGLQHDTELQALATSPLLLSIMSLAYQDCAIKDLIQVGSVRDYHKHLFNVYINRMVNRRGNTQQYSQQQTQRWLIWLAQRMNNTNQSIFLIERLQPSWALEKSQIVLYRIGSSLTFSLLFGLIFGLIFEFFRRLLIPALFHGFAAGLISGLTALLIMSSLGDIKPIENLRFTWRDLKSKFFIGLRIGLVFGLIFGSISGLILFLFNLLEPLTLIEHMSVGVIIGLFFGLIMGLFLGLFFSLRRLEIQGTTSPNQGIWSSARNAALFGVLGGMSFGFILGCFYSIMDEFNHFHYGLIYSVIGFLVFGLIGGGSACIRHFALRFVLCHLGYSPWNYARFLDYAAERLFLQKVGGGYIFVHRMLLEHFAAMPLEQEKD